MPKRKYDDLEDAPVAGGADRKKATLRAARLEQKIEHGFVLIQRALKTARGFERQKLGRRQKTARSNKDNGQIRRLEQEVDALKTLDLGVAAKHYLTKQLVKTNRIAESPVFAQLDASKRTLPQDAPKEGPVANVTARLFNSNPVRDTLPGVMEGIRGIIGLSEGKEKALSTNGPQGFPREASEESVVLGKEKRRATTEDVSMDGNDDFARFDDRLASTESESEPDVDMENPPQAAGPKYDRDQDLSVSPTPSDSESESPPAASTSQKAPSKMPAPSASSTTFLPSLTMGGYWSGSESEMEGEDAGVQAPVRKNRMGQQARRKLWEKKYGSKAKHVEKQEQNNKRPGRDSGWDPRRGATDDKTSRGKHGKDRGPRSRFRASESANAEPLGKPDGRQNAKKRADQKPLHPSWDAAKKAKEQKSQASFQGKKVVFD